MKILINKLSYKKDDIMKEITLKELAEIIEDMYNYDYRVDGARTVEEFILKLEEFSNDIIQL